MRGSGFGRFLGKSTLFYRIHLEEMVDDNEDHRHGAEEDGQSVEIVVGDHGRDYLFSLLESISIRKLDLSSFN